MMRRWCIFLSAVSCALALGCSISYAQTDEDIMELSLQSAVMFALDESPKLDIAQEQAVQADLAIDEAKSAYYPQLKATMEFGKEYNDPGVYKSTITSNESNFTNAGVARVSLRQMIFDGPVFSEVKRREQAMQSADISGAVMQERIMSDTIRSYLDIYKFQNEYTNALALTKSLEFYVNRLQQAVEAGAESEAKLKYGQARLDLANTRVATASASMNEAVHKLQLFTGPLPRFMAARPVELNLTEYDTDFYHAMATTQNTEIVLADSDIKTGQFDLERQEREYLPKVNFVVEGTHDQNFGATTEREGRAMVQLSYDIFDGFARQASKERLESKVRELEYQKQDVERELKSEISALYSEILADYEKAELKQKEALSYISLQAINKEALDQGDLDIFEVIENEERLSTAKSELNDIDVNIYLKSYDMLRAIGAMKKQRFCESC